MGMTPIARAWRGFDDEDDDEDESSSANMP
jgi:hypothetical protein